jgi:hypothetical protein
LQKFVVCSVAGPIFHGRTKVSANRDKRFCGQKSHAFARFFGREGPENSSDLIRLRCEAF